MKKSFLLMVAVLVSIAGIGFAAVKKPMRAGLDDNGYQGTTVKSLSSSKSPGDTVGFTSMDWVHNGPMGGAIVADQLGGLHFGWTYRNAAGAAVSRVPQYNFYSAATGWLGQIDVNNTGRWGTVGCKPTTGEGLFAFYFTLGTTYPTMLGIDAGQGLGMFDVYGVDTASALDKLSTHPYLAVASNDTMYIVTDGDADEFLFNSSFDGGLTWGAWRDLTDTPNGFVTDFPEMNIAAGKAGKVAISSYCANYHMMYRESNDYGQTWSTPVKVVDGVNGTSVPADGDSIKCYIHGSAFYDANNDLHIVNSYYSWSNDTLKPYHEGIIHWSQAAGLTYVHKESNTNVKSGSNTLTCSWPWMTQLDDGALVVSYTHFLPGDIAANSIANGDVWAAKSVDGGVNWFNQTNITNSPTPGAANGACDDDRYPACAALGDSIHFFWLNSKVAGTSLLGEATTMSFDPFLHYAVHKDDINGVAGKPPITREVHVLTLSQNFPNPAPARTAFSFILPKAGNFDINIYNVAGQMVDKLSGNGQAGRNTVNWSNKNIANGVYVYQLNAAGSTATQKMIILK